MELIDILRVLARHRIALALGLVPAAIVGLAVQYQVTLSPFALSERVSTSTTAQTRLLLDAPEEPPTVDLDSGVADTVGLRAGLLADLMATEAGRKTIANRSGIDPSDLAVLPPASAAPTLRVPLAVAAADAALVTSEPYVLSVAADATIPIVSFAVAAPDTGSAKRIANGAATAYEQLVAARASRGSELSVVRLGPVRTSTTVDRMHAGIGLAVSLVVLVLWAAGVVVLAGLARGWRTAGRAAA